MASVAPEPGLPVFGRAGSLVVVFVPFFWTSYWGPCFVFVCCFFGSFLGAEERGTTEEKNVSQILPTQGRRLRRMPCLLLFGTSAVNPKVHPFSARPGPLLPKRQGTPEKTGQSSMKWNDMTPPELGGM